ncbi:MAG: ABC transporter permease [Rhizobiaceae bacterium]|nr:ABC transporter permease [Rhizobiaceae bacterium]
MIDKRSSSSLMHDSSNGANVTGQPGNRDGGEATLRPLRSNHSIVPRHTIAGRALVVVIAIMTFLACLTIGGTSVINRMASGWQSDISREVTIQIRPADDREMDKAIRDASRIALSYDGVTRVTAMDDAAVARLLEPWLGSGLQLDELPVPGLLTVSLDGKQLPDFASMRQELEQFVPGASLDDHRAWVDRLTNMAWTMVMIGISVFLLVMGATVLIVIFTTRGAMAGNQEIIEVLHFVGADSVFIAKQFQRHFMTLGLIGAAVGGAIAILLFVVLGIWSRMSIATPQGDQINALFGTFEVGFSGYIGMIGVALIVAILTAVTSRMTVYRHVWVLEEGKSHVPE